MAHARQQIREAAATAVTGLTTTGSNVYTFRVYAHEFAKLPSLNIMTDGEDVDDDCLTRTVELIVEGRAKHPSALPNTLDTMAEEVETALGADPTLGGVVLRVLPPSTTIEVDDESEQPVGLITMTFQVVYRVEMGAPGTLIN